MFGAMWKPEFLSIFTGAEVGICFNGFRRKVQAAYICVHDLYKYSPRRETAGRSTGNKEVMGDMMREIPDYSYSRRN